LIDLEVLKSKKIISNKIKEVKIINGGELTKAVKLKGIQASKSVAELIEKLGGELG
jgi:large subunit ribosomal protein L15